MNPLTILCIGFLILAVCQGHTVLINRCCGPPLVYDQTLDQCANNELEQEASAQNTGSDLLAIPYSCVMRLDGNNETKFRLQNELPVSTCTDGNHIQTFNMPKNASKCSSTKLRLTSRGHLRVVGINNLTEYYSSKEFCVIGSDKTKIKFRVCNATCTKEVPCIRKCCGVGSILDLNGGNSPTCVRFNVRSWKPRFYSSATRPLPLVENDQIQPHYTYIHPAYFCHANEKTHIIEEQRDFASGKLSWIFRIGLNRNFYHRKSRYDWSESLEYWKHSCVDGAINSKYHSRDQLDVFDGTEAEDVMVLCIPKNTTNDESNQARPTIVYAITMTSSCICLLITLVVYALLWHRQNLHGWTLMSYCASLFLMYFFFIFKYIHGHTTYRGETHNLCIFIGVAVNFFFVSTFCWLTMINFDLWSKFRVLQIQPKSARGLSRYLVYVGISTAIPLTIVTVGLILDATYGSEPESAVIIPEYGVHQCGLHPGYAHWIFQNGPAGTFLLLNLVFFASTVYSIFKAQSGSKITRSAGSKNERVKLFAKLLVVMGIPYIFEFLSNLAEGENTHEGWLWVPFDVINSSQGVFIFIIFIFKRDVLRSLGEKYVSLRRFIPEASMATGTVNAESSSRNQQRKETQM